jgi:hypothetical protein
LQTTQAARPHHDQIGVDFIGNLEHRLLRVPLPDDGGHVLPADTKPLGCLLKNRFSPLPVLPEIVSPLLGDDVEQSGPGLAARGDFTQHAHHFLHMALAGIGDQKVAEHGLDRGSAAAYG